MKIRQGEDEGCRYDLAENLDDEQMKDDEDQFEALLEENERQEHNDNSFTFDNEDFYDDDMTEEDI